MELCCYCGKTSQHAIVNLYLNILKTYTEVNKTHFAALPSYMILVPSIFNSMYVGPYEYVIITVLCIQISFRFTFLLNIGFFFSLEFC